MSAAAADGKVERLIDVERDIQDFLTYYPGDRRCRELQTYLDEIELHRLERKFEFRSKFLAKNEGLSAVERAYIEAMGYVHLDPGLGRRKLQALVDLYRETAQGSKQSRECLLLAQRQLQRFERLEQDQAREDRGLIEKQLRRADELDATAPDEAERIRRAVVELYADEQWAEPLVAEARRALEHRRAIPVTSP